MPAQIATGLSLAFAAYLAATAVYIISENRRPSATFAWMLLFFVLPGAGVIVYLLFVVLIGLPLVIAELSLGRRAQGDAVSAFTLSDPAVPGSWPVAGWIAVATSAAGIYGLVRTVTGASQGKG